MEHSAFGIDNIETLHGSIILHATGKLLIRVHEVLACGSLFYFQMPEDAFLYDKITCNYTLECLK